MEFQNSVENNREYLCSKQFSWGRMKIINAHNCNNHVTNMSKRVKTKPKVRANIGTGMTRKNVDDKESADRIAAAEAMSCLSSTPFILPSSSDSIVTAVTDQRLETTGDSVAIQDMIMTVSKRGKSKQRRGGKRSPVKTQQTNSYITENNVTVSQNSNASGTISNDSCKPSTSHQSVINFQSVNTASISQASLIAQQLSNLVKIQKEKQEKADAMPSHSNIKFSLQQMLELKRAQSQDHSQSSTNSVLKLPLTVSTTESNLARDMASPSSVTSSESIELPQTTVDHILNSNKYDTPEASLPLKKRRLQTYKDGEVPATESGLPLQKVVDLTTDKQDQNKDHNRKQQVDASKTGTSGMFVNPQMSLMLLNEIQMALHQDEDGDLPLHIAVAQENIVMVQKFVHLMTISGKNVDKYNKSLQTPLHLAVELQFDQAVSVLLMAGANPSLVNNEGDSAVHLAVKYNTINNLALMLIKSQHKADINARNFEGLAPLHLAVIKNQIEMVKVLIRCGADINIQDGKSGRTPLFHAVEGNQLALVMLFRQCNANLELTNYAGITALMAAQAKGFSEASSVLMVGLDPKAIIEHKEKEKMMMPNKKMPIPRIPSKAHLIVPVNQRGIKKESNSENETSSQGNSQESEDVKQRMEGKIDTQQLYERAVREFKMKSEIKDSEVGALEIDRKEIVEQKPLQLTVNIPVKKEKLKRNKQKKIKKEIKQDSDIEISSEVVVHTVPHKGPVNSVVEKSECETTLESTNNTSKTVPISGTNAAKPLSAAENVTSINARTASLLAAHLKSMKNALTSSKHGSSFPLNLSCDGKETGNYETTSTTLSNGS